jgi:hypothetical protein
VTELAFLSPDRAGPEAQWRSPLARALEHATTDVTDISLTGKLELRGDVGTLRSRALEIFPITPERALVLCDFTKTSEIRERLSDHFLVIDMSAALAGLQVRGETLMRRLTDLDLEALPAVGPIAHVQAYVLRSRGDVFRFFFPQEYGDYLAEVVVDAAEGLQA